MAQQAKLLMIFREKVERNEQMPAKQYQNIFVEIINNNNGMKYRALKLNRSQFSLK